MTRTLKPQLSSTVDGILFGWRAQADQHHGSATFASIVPGPTFTLFPSGKLHMVVDTLSTREATAAEEQELRSALAAGQVEITLAHRGSRNRIVLHAATGNPLPAGGEA
ncbi:hypothetical protein IIE18_10795 [Pseudomonas sp. V1]|uniref:hypothetical protein n=1 Tax=Pseudomonas arcuscaelestis TaxID=2710591 RepID=UPI0019401EC7|nr:hypothetical protein [Pseudomonas arcuscaelestis]MBM3105628.1 hypothetical protein [Pseudomonas arcuscaelestis]